MKYVLTMLVACAALALLAAPATADWNEDDYAKWVQYPDLNGWDVDFTEQPPFDPTGNPGRFARLADDFECTQYGPLSDFHLWFSVQGDQLYRLIEEEDMGEVYWVEVPIAVEQAIEGIHLSLHRDIPANTDPDPVDWSRPGPEEWGIDIPLGDPRFTIRKLEEEGDQEFYWPPYEHTGGGTAPDHHGIWQANVVLDPATDRIYYQEGTRDEPVTYWLDASIRLHPDIVGCVGWKTSIDHWNDDAVYWVEDVAGGVHWYPLEDPVQGGTLDLAFVITPEPGTIMMLLGAGLIGLVAFARRRRTS